MLLTTLTGESEKTAFLNLAYLVAKSDGCLGYAEKALIDLFSLELGIDPSAFRLKQEPLAQLCHRISSSNKQDVAFANLLLLASVDGYDNDAKKHILKIIKLEFRIISEQARTYETETKILAGSYYPDYMD